MNGNTIKGNNILSFKGKYSLLHNICNLFQFSLLFSSSRMNLSQCYVNLNVWQRFRLVSAYFRRRLREFHTIESTILEPNVRSTENYYDFVNINSISLNFV